MAVLVEQPERTLLSLVALARQVLECLLASHHLAAAYNSTVLVLHKISLLEATGGVLRGTVPDLSLGANCGDRIGHLILRTRIFNLPVRRLAPPMCLSTIVSTSSSPPSLC